MLSNFVPVCDEVVSNPPVIRPIPDSLIDSPAVTVTAPPFVARLPAFSVTFPFAVSLRSPVPLLTSELTRMSLPVDVNVTWPDPSAVMVPSIVSVSLADRLIGPLTDDVVTLPVVVSAPVWFTTI